MMGLHLRLGQRSQPRHYTATSIEELEERLFVLKDSEVEFIHNEIVF